MFISKGLDPFSERRSCKYQQCRIDHYSTCSPVKAAYPNVVLLALGPPHLPGHERSTVIISLASEELITVPLTVTHAHTQHTHSRPPQTQQIHTQTHTQHTHTHNTHTAYSPVFLRPVDPRPPCQSPPELSCG